MRSSQLPLLVVLYLAVAFACVHGAAAPGARADLFRPGSPEGGNLVHAGRQLHLLGVGGSVPGGASHESTFGGGTGGVSLLPSGSGTTGGSWSVLGGGGSGVGNGNNNVGSSNGNNNGNTQILGSSALTVSPSPTPTPSAAIALTSNGLTLPGSGDKGAQLGQTAATTPPAALALGLSSTPPPVANALTQPGTGSGLGGKPAGFGGFGDSVTTPAPVTPTPPVALGTALGSDSNPLLGSLPKGISTGSGLGSASAATPPPSTFWNGKRPDGSADGSANGQWWSQPGGGGLGGSVANPRGDRGEPWGKTTTPPPTPPPVNYYSRAPGYGVRRGHDNGHGHDGPFGGFGFGRRLQQRAVPASPADRPWRAAAFGAAGGQRKLATASALVAGGAPRKPAGDALLDAALADNLAVHRKDMSVAPRR